MPRHAIFPLLLTLFLAACNTTKPVDIPTISESETSSRSLGVGEAEASFALARIVADLRTGDVIAAFPSSGPEVKGLYCNYKMKGNNVITWGAGRQYLGNWSTELGAIFFETLSGRGFKVAGDPSDLFEQERGPNSAQYLTGGRIVNMKGNFCHQHHWWDGSPLFEYSGRMYVEVEWSIYDSLTKTVVFKKSLGGTYKQEEAVQDGIMIAFHNAFAASAERFAAEAIPQKLARGERTAEPVATRVVGQTAAITQGEIAEAFDINVLAPHVVTILVAESHGSGFFVGTQGHIVTNAHVVGDAKRVLVRTSTSLEVEAEVISRDPVRDVALLRTPIRLPHALHLKTAPPAISETVYAIGTPRLKSLHGTLTRGIVSALRKEDVSGLTYIQSDVATSPGSSGGPLLDSRGSVVGITVSGITGESVSGLNLFIPLGDALEKLGVKLEG